MICLDTNALIWGVQGLSSSDPPADAKRMAAYLRHLTKEGTRIMVPAPVAYEFLSGVERDEISANIEMLEKLFYLPAFDIPASAVAAQLNGNSKLVKELAQGGVDKQRLRIDAQIVAIAIVQNADMIISDDPHLKAMAQGRIRIEPVPDITEQTDLFQPP